MAMFLASCSDSNSVKKGDDPPVTGTENIAVITISSDFSAANFEVISIDDYTVTPNLYPGLHTDLTIRTFNSEIYILERFLSDKVIKYDAQLREVYIEPLSPGLNIQDIVVVSRTKAYISALGSSDLIVFNPFTGKQISTIDLSEFAAFAGTEDAAEHPFASALAVYGDFVYVACQRLDASFGVADVSQIAIININDDKVVGSIDLNRKNPTAMSVFGSKMLVASAGDYGFEEDGGIELIDLASNKNEGVIADGVFTDVIFVSADKAYIAEMLPDWSTGISPLDLSTKTVGTAITGIGDGSGKMAFHDGKLYVGDRGFGSAGVAVVSISTNTVDQTIATGMPPAGLGYFSRINL
ncbi:MAG: hypothetical protein FWE57_02265 [Chitinispirillia bacterium]|nr:hypothetical protein [Chitinispirillia bacterium]